MRKATIRRAAAVLSMVAAVAAATVTMSPTRASTGGNDSVFIYDTGGTAVIGTMTAGQFDHVQTLDVGAGWTHAAASSDSLMLYNRNSGLIETGHLSGGIYSRATRRVTGKGYTHLTASCNSYLLYKNWTGQREIGRLEDGVSTRVTSGSGFSTGWDLISASCDTIRFVKHTNGDPSRHGAINVLGVLWDGGFAQTMSYEDAEHSDATKPVFTGLAMTHDQQVIYTPNHPYYNAGGYARWNGAVHGSFGFDDEPAFEGGSRNGLSDHWDLVSGTADTVIFYDATSGQTATATLDRDGTFTQQNVYGWSAGWDIIAGGK